jgi:hypothetical protein
MDLFATAEKLALVFVAQEREITLTWSIAEKYYRTLFLQRDTMFRDILLSRKTPLILQNLSFGWKIFGPFSHQHLRGYFTQFL